MPPIPTIMDQQDTTSKLSVSKMSSMFSLDSISSSTTSSPKHHNNFSKKGGTDAKLYFGFLKRRLTDGSLKAGSSSISIRPSPDEATKWSNSFQDLISSKYGQSLFNAFLKREFCDENFEFWLAVEAFRKVNKEHKLINKAQKIYNEFIIPNSPKEINLDSATRDNIINKMSQPPTHLLFDQARKKVQNLLESDAYPRFLKSDLYLELLYPEDYQEFQDPSCILSSSI